MKSLAFDSKTRAIGRRVSLFCTIWILQCGFSMTGESLPLFACLGLTYFILSFFFTSLSLAIVALAMIFSPEFSVGAIGERQLALRIEDFLIPMMLLAWIARSSTQRNRALFADTPLNVPVLALLVFSLISSLVGVTRQTVGLLPAFFYQAKVVEYFVLFYVVLNFIRTEAQVKTFLLFALVTVALLVLYTLPQVPTAQVYSEHRITAPFEGTPQPATAGGYFAFCFLLVFSILIYQKSALKKVLLAILCVGILVPLLYSFSRTAYLTLLGGVVLLAFVTKIRWLRLTVLAVLILSPVVLPSKVKERIAHTWVDGQRVNRAYGVDLSFGERISSFSRAWDAIKKNPVLGLGVASWEYPDNQYARTLHELSVPGLVLWLWIFFRLFKMSSWLYKTLEDGTLKGLALGYSAGIVGILLHCTGSCTFYIVRIMEPFWFISGLIVALYNLKVEEYREFSGTSRHGVS